MGIKSKPLRIVLASLAGVLAIFYFIIVQYSFPQMEGTWAAFVREEKISRISSEPGFKIIIPGEQVFNLPKTMLSTEIAASRYYLADFPMASAFVVLWKVDDPRLYLDSLVAMDKTDSAVIDPLQGYFNDTFVPGNGYSIDDFEVMLDSLPAQLNPALKRDHGIHIDSIKISDLRPAVDDNALQQHSAETDKPYSEKLKILQTITRQLSRDRK
jgi:regulator of protease activity HflC (stomatin/prohibitin superfamily)